jgi:hypothetical protein
MKKYHSDAIREAYQASERGIALVVAQPGDIRVSMLEVWDGGYTDPNTSFGLVDETVQDCKALHAEIGGKLPAVYFVVLEGGEWTGEVMPIAFMSRGGLA